MTRSKPLTLSRTLAYVAAFAMCLWILVPIYFITLAAFSTQQSVYRYPNTLVPAHVTTSTLSYFIHSPGVLDSLKVSLLVAAITLAISLAIGTPAGYALERFAFRGEGVFRMTLVTTRTFPIVALAIPMSTTFIQWGIDDTVWAVALVHAALSIPFVVLVTASVFANISRELEEAAQTLGCNRAQAFARVVLPLARPGFAAAAIFTFITSWNEVFAASVLTLQHPTLPAEVLAVLESSPLPFKYAGGFFMLFPAFFVIFFSRKYLFNTFSGTAR